MTESTDTTERADFTDLVTDVEHLRSLYREPSGGALAKETTTLDEGCRDFIAQSTFVVVGTSDADGRLDVSPRGGPAGFVKVLDDHRLVIPDLNGNNRLDSIRNVIDHGRIALLFLIPGLDETLRVNGRASITIADDVLDLFVDELRRPKSAIGVTIEQGFIHCAKAFRRGAIWNHDEWPDASCRPSVGQILADHAELGDRMTGAEVETALEASYVEDLAADAPTDGAT